MVEDDTPDRELDTLIVRRTDIAELVVVAACRKTIFEDEVFGGVPIEVDGSAQTLIPETVVHTDITGDGGLPFEVGIGCDERTAAYAVNEHIVHILHVVGSVVEDIIDIEVTEIDIVVTHSTVGQTPFPVAHHILRRSHPWLVYHAPCNGSGREETPLVALREFRRSIRTESSGEVVPSE